MGASFIFGSRIHPNNKGLIRFAPSPWLLQGEKAIFQYPVKEGVLWFRVNPNTTAIKLWILEDLKIFYKNQAEMALSQ